MGLLAVPVAQAQEEVIIEATPPAASQAEVLDAGAVAVAVDAADVLDAAAGVAIRRLGGPGAFAGVSLRGSTFRQVQVHLDGVPLNPDGSDAADLSELPAALLADVRLWRGFSPPSYGAAAMGGVIDVRLAAPSRQPAGGAGLRAGSYGLVELHGAASAGGPRSGLLVAADALSSQGDFRFWDDGGTRFVPGDDALAVRLHNRTAQATGLLRWSAQSPTTSISFLESWLLREEDQAGPVGAPTTAAHASVRRALTGLSLTHTLPRGALSARLWGITRADRLDDPRAEVGIGAAWQRDDVVHAGLALGLQGQVHPTTRLGVDLHLRTERAARTTPAGTASLSSRQVLTLAPSATVRLASERLTLEPVLDLRLLSIRGETQAQVLPRLALSLAPAPWIGLGLAAARGFRPPDLAELIGVRAGWRGNTTLRPESSWLGEASLRLHGERGALRGALDLTGYVQAARDRIVWLQNAQRSLVPVNLSRTRVAGLELTAIGGWRPWLDLRLAAAWQEARDLDAGALPLVPAWQGDLTLATRPHPWLRLAATLEHTAGVWQDSANLSRQPARLTLDASADLTLGDTGLTLGAALRNLTDRIAADVPADPLYPDGPVTRQAVTDVAGWPLPGRTLLVQLRWSPSEAR